MSLSKQELFEAIKLARPLLVLFICIAHVPGINGYVSDYDQYNQPITLFAVYLKDFLARGSVPILTVISGYLAYSSFQKRSYSGFVKEKTKRLFVPFAIWNMLLIASAWCVFQLFQVNLVGIEKITDTVSFLKALLGIHRLPINAPTYFVRDLFMIMLALPIIRIACLTRLSFIVSCSAYILLFWDKPGIALHLVGQTFYIILRTDMVLFFMLGYFLAIHQKSVPRLSSYSCFTQFILIGAFGFLFSILISSTTPSALHFVQWRALVGILFVCIAPAILMALLSLRNTYAGRLLAWFSPYSFTLFLSHTISLFPFMAITRSYLDWRVTERYPAYEQLIYIVCYLFFVAFGAFVILTVWNQLKTRYLSLQTPQLPTPQ